MTDLRKAAEQALEALEDVVKWYASRDANENLMPCHNQNPEIKLSMESVEALRQALAQEEQEPVAWMGVDSWGVVTKFRTNPFGGAIPLYKAPPKREWASLTGYQRLKFADRFHISGEAIEAIEAKLKEKNCG